KDKNQARDSERTIAKNKRERGTWFAWWVCWRPAYKRTIRRTSSIYKERKRLVQRDKSRFIYRCFRRQDRRRNFKRKSKGKHSSRNGKWKTAQDKRKGNAIL